MTRRGDLVGAQKKAGCPPRIVAQSIRNSHPAANYSCRGRANRCAAHENTSDRPPVLSNPPIFAERSLLLPLPDQADEPVQFDKVPTVQAECVTLFATAGDLVRERTGRKPTVPRRVFGH